MEHAIEQARRRNGILAVMFIDLDHFKEVNDRFGHAAGDSVLQEVARAMRDSLREEDTLARLGGDEFVVLVEDVESEEAALGVAERLLAVFPRRLGRPDIEIGVTASIGVSFYPRDGDSASKLLAHADGAMYQVKAEGRANIALFREIAPALEGRPG